MSVTGRSSQSQLSKLSKVYESNSRDSDNVESPKKVKYRKKGRRKKSKFPSTTVVSLNLANCLKNSKLDLKTRQLASAKRYKRETLAQNREINLLGSTGETCSQKTYHYNSNKELSLKGEKVSEKVDSSALKYTADAATGECNAEGRNRGLASKVKKKPKKLGKGFATIGKKFTKEFIYFAKNKDAKIQDGTISYENTLRWFKKARIIDNRRVTIRDVEVHFIDKLRHGHGLTILEFISFLKTLSDDRGLKVSKLVKGLMSCRVSKKNTNGLSICQNVQGEPKMNDTANKADIKSHQSPKATKEFLKVVSSKKGTPVSGKDSKFFRTASGKKSVQPISVFGILSNDPVLKWLTRRCVSEGLMKKEERKVKKNTAAGNNTAFCSEVESVIETDASFIPDSSVTSKSINEIDQGSFNFFMENTGEDPGSREQRLSHNKTVIRKANKIVYEFKLPNLRNEDTSDKNHKASKGPKICSSEKSQKTTINGSIWNLLKSKVVTKSMNIQTKEPENITADSNLARNELPVFEENEFIKAKENQGGKASTENRNFSRKIDTISCITQMKTKYTEISSNTLTPTIMRKHAQKNKKAQTTIEQCEAIKAVNNQHTEQNLKTMVVKKEPSAVESTSTGKYTEKYQYCDQMQNQRNTSFKKQKPIRKKFENSVRASLDGNTSEISSATKSLATCPFLERHRARSSSNARKCCSVLNSKNSSSKTLREKRYVSETRKDMECKKGAKQNQELKINVIEWKENGSLSEKFNIVTPEVLEETKNDLPLPEMIKLEDGVSENLQNEACNVSLENLVYEGNEPLKKSKTKMKKRTGKKPQARTFSNLPVRRVENCRRKESPNKFNVRNAKGKTSTSVSRQKTLPTPNKSAQSCQETYDFVEDTKDIGQRNIPDEEEKIQKENKLGSNVRFNASEFENNIKANTSQYESQSKESADDTKTKNKVKLYKIRKGVKVMKKDLKDPETLLQRSKT